MSALTGQRVLVVGGGSGIGRRIAEVTAGAGADVVLAGRSVQRLAPEAERIAATTGQQVTTVHLDLADEASIAAAADEVGELDHVVSLAADHANGPVASLEADAVTGAFAAKVVGPILLAKHLRVRGSYLLFSGVAAWRPAAGLTVMATTNGAVAFLASALAVELAPVRVNALSPGIVDSGAWDGMAERDAFFADTAAKNPVGRVGTPEDIADAALGLLTNGFVTGQTLHVDGGGRLA